MEGFEFDFGGGLFTENEGNIEVESVDIDKVAAKRSHRRSTMCTELSQKYEYRRAFSEVKMLEAMRYRRLEQGYSYNFITAGDVDALSYLKIVLNQHDLDYVLMSSWVICAEDFLQIRQWYEAGRIRALDMYLGEIFPGSYKVEWSMVCDFYNSYPDAGRVAIFKNHAKIWGGYNKEEDFYFAAQTSANATQNPRTEQGCITIDRGLFEFYKEYFDGINSYKIK